MPDADDEDDDDWGTWQRRRLPGAGPASSVVLGFEPARGPDDAVAILSGETETPVSPSGTVWPESGGNHRNQRSRYQEAVGRTDRLLVPGPCLGPTWRLVVSPPERFHLFCIYAQVLLSSVPPMLRYTFKDRRGFFNFMWIDDSLSTTRSFRKVTWSPWTRKVCRRRTEKSFVYILRDKVVSSLSRGQPRRTLDWSSLSKTDNSRRWRGCEWVCAEWTCSWQADSRRKAWFDDSFNINRVSGLFFSGISFDHGRSMQILSSATFNFDASVFYPSNLRSWAIFFSQISRNVTPWNQSSRISSNAYSKSPFASTVSVNYHSSITVTFSRRQSHQRSVRFSVQNLIFTPKCPRSVNFAVNEVTKPRQSLT